MNEKLLIKLLQSGIDVETAITISKEFNPEAAADPEDKPAAAPEAKPAAAPDVKPADAPDVKPAAAPEAKPAGDPVLAEINKINESVNSAMAEMSKIFSSFALINANNVQKAARGIDDINAEIIAPNIYKDQGGK